MLKYMVLVGAIAIQPAFAQQNFQVQQSAPPMKFDFGGKTPDVAGIYIGMPTSEADAIVVKEAGKASVIRFQSSMFDTSSGLSTQPYVQRSEYQLTANPSTNMKVFFGTPATGGGVLSVYRNTFWPPAAAGQQQPPSEKDLQAQLIQKYGTPSIDTVDGGHNHTMRWNFNSSGLVKCDSPACRQSIDADTLDLHHMEMPQIQQAIKDGRVIVITAMFSAPGGGPVNTLRVDMASPTAADHTMKEIRKVLGARAAALRQSAPPPAPVKL